MAAGNLDDLVASYLDLRWHFDPVEASAAGLAAHDGRLGSFTEGDIGQHLAALRSVMGALEGIDVEDLEDEIDRTALLNELRFSVNRFQHERPHTRDPGFWLGHAFEGLHLMLALRDRPVAARAQAASARLAALPAFLAAARATLAECPRVLVDLARERAAGGAALIHEISTTLVPSDDPRFSAHCDAARAALAEFVQHLDGTLAREATGGFAVGEAAFEFRLHFQHALRDSSQVLWKFGHALVAEVERDLASLAASLRPGRQWPDVMEELRANHPDTGGLVDAYAGAMERARAFVESRDLVPIPPGPLDVVATPPFLRPTVPFAAYQPPGAFSPERTGWFYVTVPDGADRGARETALRDHSAYEIPAIALHEGYPGHHVQFLNAHALSRPLRRVLWTPVTVEGWALYCEQMMSEEGFFAMPEERFFQQIARLLRAVRVIVDIGLHTRGMSYEDAVDLMIDRARLDRAHAEAEVRRYCAEPAYQLAYAVGERELRRLREGYRQARGDAYVLREFHAAVLAYGGLPVSLMRWGLGIDG